MYCTNCGQQLDENGVCPNCGNSVSSPTQQNHPTPPTLEKRSNLFTILYIVSVVIFMIEALMRINETQDLLSHDVEAYISQVHVNFYPLRAFIRNITLNLFIFFDYKKRYQMECDFNASCVFICNIL